MPKLLVTYGIFFAIGHLPTIVSYNGSYIVQFEAKVPHVTKLLPKTYVEVNMTQN